VTLDFGGHLFAMYKDSPQCTCGVRHQLVDEAMEQYVKTLAAADDKFEMKRFVTEKLCIQWGSSTTNKLKEWWQRNIIGETYKKDPRDWLAHEKQAVAGAGKP